MAKAERSLLVTGGSRGIGAAVCRLAAQRGYAVAVNFAANKQAADALVAEIIEQGGRAISVQGDVSIETDVVSMFDAVTSEFGCLDAFVNNAGIVAEASQVADMSIERLERMISVNLTGALVCAREAVRLMSTKRGGNGGSIVNVSSVAATLGGYGQYVDYAATKGAIDTLTIGLAREVAEEGIRVNGVRPGIIDTEIHASGGQPDRPARLSHLIPVKRPGTAQEVAEAILYLLSDNASYITGATLDVTGGR